MCLAGINKNEEYFCNKPISKKVVNLLNPKKAGRIANGVTFVLTGGLNDVDEPPFTASEFLCTSSSRCLVFSVFAFFGVRKLGYLSRPV